MSLLESALFKSIFQYSGNNFRLAVLKIIPKIHKLSQPITLRSIDDLSSRPIRGGELCPLNSSSIVLRNLYQHLHSDVKLKLFPIYSNTYPIVLGTSSFSIKLLPPKPFELK